MLGGFCNRLIADLADRRSVVALTRTANEVGMPSPLLSSHEPRSSARHAGFFDRMQRVIDGAYAKRRKPPSTSDSAT